MWVVKPWLVVEDEEDIRNVVKIMFQAWGHAPMEFCDGHEAWRWLDTVEAGTYGADLPEFALMDIRMPGHRGHEIARRIRDVRPLHHIPIVLMTAFSLSDGERNDMLQNYGVDKIINKPLPDFFRFKALLDEVCKKKQPTDGTTSGSNGDAASGSNGGGNGTDPTNT
jgi:CheY-like chemotaxis protein